MKWYPSGTRIETARAPGAENIFITFGYSALNDDGCSLKGSRPLLLGKLLGHTQVQTTARYAHLARDTVKASAARIGDSIDGDLEAPS